MSLFVQNKQQAKIEGSTAVVPMQLDAPPPKQDAKPDTKPFADEKKKRYRESIAESVRLSTEPQIDVSELRLLRARSSLLVAIGQMDTCDFDYIKDLISEQPHCGCAGLA
jgi:hypothetical protein